MGSIYAMSIGTNSVMDLQALLHLALVRGFRLARNAEVRSALHIKISA
jgi:hypothetical protein